MWDVHVKHKYLLKYLIVLVLGSSRRCLRSSWLCLCLYRFFSINFVIFSEQKFFGTSREDYCEKMYGLCSKILFARGFVQKKKWTIYMVHFVSCTSMQDRKGKRLNNFKSSRSKVFFKKDVLKKKFINTFFHRTPLGDHFCNSRFQSCYSELLKNYFEILKTKWKTMLKKS